MTEQEAIKILSLDEKEKKLLKNLTPVYEVAIKALEEVQKYRAIGTLEGCRSAVEKQKAKKPIIEHEETKDCVTEMEWKCPVCGTNYI